MIPAIFQAKAVAERGTDEAALLYGKRQAAAAIGIISAVGALGGFLITAAFGMSFAPDGQPGPLAFAGVRRLLRGLRRRVTWWCYTAHGAASRSSAPAWPTRRV